MDDNLNRVICPGCNSRYKRPANIPETGVNVKCKHCGRIFLVKPLKSSMIADPFKDSLVKQEDGKVVKIGSLAEIQQKIITGEISGSDMYSGNGTDWKELSTIEMLDPFFSIVKKASMVKEETPEPSPQIEENNEVIAPPSIDDSAELFDPSKDGIESDSEDMSDLFDEYETNSRGKILKIIIAFAILGAAAFAAYSFLSKPVQKAERKVVEKVAPEKKPDRAPSPEAKEKSSEITDTDTDKASTAEKKISKTPVKKQAPAPKKKLEKKVIKQKAPSAASLIKRGWRNLDNENIEGAISQFQKALKLNPNAAEAYYGLGEAYNLRGNKAKAREFYQKYISLPNAKNRGEVKSILNNL